jgi:hypothetical protein
MIPSTSAVPVSFGQEDNLHAGLMDSSPACWALSYPLTYIPTSSAAEANDASFAWACLALLGHCLGVPLVAGLAWNAL